MTTSKTAALAIARARVHAPIRRSSTDYLVIGPHRDHEPHGPYTEQQRSSYSAALDVMTRWRAEVAACAVLGRPLSEDEEYAGHVATGPVGHRLERILRAAARAAA